MKTRKSNHWITLRVSFSSSKSRILLAGFLFSPDTIEGEVEESAEPLFGLERRFGFFIFYFLFPEKWTENRGNDDSDEIIENKYYCKTTDQSIIFREK